MKRYFAKKRRNNKGQSIVELAIALPLLLILIFAMMAIGFYIYDMSVYTFAANKALDKGIGLAVSGRISEADIDEIRLDAFNYANVGLFVSTPTVEVRNDKDDFLGKTKLTVSIQSDYNFSISFVNDILGDNPKVTSKNTYIYKTP